MSKKQELENILKAEIVLAAKKLLSAADKESFDKTVERFEKLYGKIAAYRYLKNSHEENWEFLFRETQNQHEEKPVEKKEAEPPVKDEKSSITRSPATRIDSPRNPIKNHAPLYKKAVETKFQPKKKSNAGFQIGLADKIALLNNLFAKDQTAFEEFVRRIDEAQNYDEALEWVHQTKEKFNWSGKDEYEFRLIQLIQAKFS